MLEKIYSFSTLDEKNIEMLIDDDQFMLNHMILPKDAGIPEHYSNSNVYVIVVRGTLSLQLEDQEVHHYQNGSIVNIPYHKKMKITNFNDDILEFFVAKAPSPRMYKEGK